MNWKLRSALCSSGFGLNLEGKKADIYTLPQAFCLDRAIFEAHWWVGFVDFSVCEEINQLTSSSVTERLCCMNLFNASAGFMLFISLQKNKKQKKTGLITTLAALGSIVFVFSFPHIIYDCCLVMLMFSKTFDIWIVAFYFIWILFWISFATTKHVSASCGRAGTADLLPVQLHIIVQQCVINICHLTTIEANILLPEKADVM